MAMRSGEATAPLNVCYSFEAPREAVFDAWLDPASVGQWLFATPTGVVIKILIDPRAGGHYTIVDKRGNEEVEHTGEYLKIQRPSRLRFTFLVPKYSSDSTTVTIDLRSTPMGCDLLLTHEGVYPEFAAATRAGWISILATLGKTLTL